MRSETRVAMVRMGGDGEGERGLSYEFIQRQSAEPWSYGTHSVKTNKVAMAEENTVKVDHCSGVGNPKCPNSNPWAYWGYCEWE